MRCSGVGLPCCPVERLTGATCGGRDGRTSSGRRFFSRGRAPDRASRPARVCQRRFLARPSAGPGVSAGARVPATARGDRRLRCRRAGPPRASVAPAARRGPASARQRAGFASRSPQSRTLLGEHRVCLRRYQWTTARLSYLSIDAIGRSIPPHTLPAATPKGDQDWDLQSAPPLRASAVAQPVPIPPSAAGSGLRFECGLSLVSII